MKKMMVLVLAVVLMASLACGAMAAVDATEYEFRADTVKALDMSTAEWLYSKESRALLVVLMGYDLESQRIGFDSDALKEETIYVAEQDGLASVAFDTGRGDVYYTVFNPKKGMVVCEHIRDCDANDMRVMYEYMGVPCYEVSNQEIQDAASWFLELIAGY